ncbi:MAG: spondin domain-containing protein [Kangiellaceae bacterium]
MKTKLFKLSLLTLLVTLATGCVDDGDTGAVGPQGPAGVDGSDGADGQDGNDGANGTNGNTAVYTVQITNLTYSQPLSPAAIIMHEPGYYAFVEGQSASVELEQLAEGGDPSGIVSTASTQVQFLDGIATSGPIGPRSIGSESTLVVPDLDADNLRLSIATMLVDTNDAFTGLNAMDISNMEVGDSRAFMAPSWDSGTEANLETADTMPGPAAAAAGGGGTAAGFDAARDDLFDRVRLHAGAVTNANANDASKEGLSTSILTEADRWDNPTAKILVTRTR